MSFKGTLKTYYILWGQRAASSKGKAGPYTAEERAAGTGHPPAADGQVESAKRGRQVAAETLCGNQGTQAHQRLSQVPKGEEAKTDHGSPRVTGKVSRPGKTGESQTGEQELSRAGQNT